MRSVLTLFALCSLFLVGCATDVLIRGDAQRAREVRSVVVLPLLDDAVEGEGRDRALYGSTAEFETGAMVRAALAEELERTGAFKVLHGRTLAAECVRRGIHLEALNDMSPQEVAAVFGADAAIFGEMVKARKSWLFFAAKERMEFRLQCVESGTGETLWTAEADGFAWGRVDIPHAQKAGRRIAEWLASGEDFFVPVPVREERMLQRHPLLGDVPAPTGKSFQSGAELPG